MTNTIATSNMPDVDKHRRQLAVALNRLSLQIPDHDITPEEQAAGLTLADLNLRYPPGNVKRYGATGDGINDDRPALSTAFNIGIPVFIPHGKYLLDSSDTSQWGVLRSSDVDLHIVCQGTIVAGANLENVITMPGAMIRIQTATNPATPLPNFSWTGGRFEMSALDTQGAGGIGGLSIGPKFENVALEDLEMDHGIQTAVGVDIGVGGGDQSIFCKEPEHFTAINVRCYGAPDLGFYLSGDDAANRFGRHASITGCKFVRCNNGVGMKRDFEFTYIGGCTFLECVNGILWGRAGGSQINQGKRGLIIGNTFRRMQGGPLNLSNNFGIAVIGNEMIDYRRWISDGTTPTQVASGNIGAGIRFSGCSGCTAVGNISGFEDWVAPTAAEFQPAYAVALLLDNDPEPDVESNNNIICGNVLKNCVGGIFTAVQTNNNVLAPNQSFGHTGLDHIDGTGNVSLPLPGGDGSGVRHTPGAGFVAIDVNGTNAIRFLAQTGDVNFVQSSAAPMGDHPSIRARGDNVNIDLILSGRAAGLVRFGTLQATADVPITGFIQIKDEAGTVRKLAVID